MSKYRRSDGTFVDIEGMVHPHLCASLAKLEREEPHRQEEIQAMRRQRDSNETAFRAKIEELKGAGYFVREAPGGWFGFPPGGSMQIATGKTEDAAWNKLLAHRAARAE